MRKHLTRGLPSPAMAVAITALFVALGGTGYAASKLVEHSPAAHAAKKKKSSNDTKADTKLVNKLASGLSVKSAGTATNASHATSADSATNATNAGNATNLGGAAASAYEKYGATLPVGQTEVGAYEMDATAAASGDSLGDSLSFPMPLAAAPTVHFIPTGTTPPSQCPGTKAAPAAQSGNLCIYEAAKIQESSMTFFNPTTGASGTSRFGVGMFLTSSGSGNFYSDGTWAVTG